MRKAGAPSCFYSAACRSDWCSTSVNLIQTLHHYTAVTASSKLNKPITDLQSLCISFFVFTVLLWDCATTVTFITAELCACYAQISTNQQMTSYLL